jgi:hypothetical protein
MNQCFVFVGVFAALFSAAVFAQDDNAATDGDTASGQAAAVDEFDREPERCIQAYRIDRTEVINDRTILFHMTGSQIYLNELTQECRRLDRSKRFSYTLRTSQLCDVDFITVIEGFGSSLRQGVSCGLGMFYPITEEEAELLDADPDEMLEAAGAIKETIESSGEAVIPGDESDEN